METQQSTRSQTDTPVQYPTIDFISDNFSVQFHLVDMLASLPQENVLTIGTNAYYTLQRSTLYTPVQAILQVGTSIDIVQNNSIQNNEVTELWIQLQPRLGIELSEEYGTGLYIFPSIGWAQIPLLSDTDYSMQQEVVAGGGIQLSIWRN